jgi:hypothetical protein
LIERKQTLAGIALPRHPSIIYCGRQLFRYTGVRSNLPAMLAGDPRQPVPIYVIDADFVQRYAFSKAGRNAITISKIKRRQMFCQSYWKLKFALFVPNKEANERSL